MADPSNIRFPTKKTDSIGGLSLRRPRPETGSPFTVSEATAAARESIRAIVSATRPPLGIRGGAEDARIADLERSLRQLELKLAERERIVQEREARLKEFELASSPEARRRSLPPGSSWSPRRARRRLRRSTSHPRRRLRSRRSGPSSSARKPC